METAETRWLALLVDKADIEARQLLAERPASKSRDVVSRLELCTGCSSIFSFFAIASTLEAMMRYEKDIRWQTTKHVRKQGGGRPHYLITRIEIFMFLVKWRSNIPYSLLGSAFDVSEASALRAIHRTVSCLECEAFVSSSISSLLMRSWPGSWWRRRRVLPDQEHAYERLTNSATWLKHRLTCGDTDENIVDEQLYNDRVERVYTAFVDVSNKGSRLDKTYFVSPPRAPIIYKTKSGKTYVI